MGSIPSLGNSFTRTKRLGLAAALSLTCLTPVAVLAQDAQAPKVTVAEAALAEVQASENFVARGEAIDKVDLIARVSGYLEEILVENGSLVSEGDLLFRIEDDTYRASVQSAEAEVAKAEANLELAKLDLARKQELFVRGSVPEAERDTARANELVAEAQLQAAHAAVAQANLNLSYTEVYAPFSGRIGRINISEGDVIGPNSGPLVNIVRESPVYVTFSLNEKQFVDFLQVRQAEGAPTSGADVFVILPNNSELPEKGQIAFVDNRVDPTTGTIALRAEFENAAGLLLDGAYMAVSLRSRETQEEIVISQAAIQRDQQGPFVLVVGDDNLAEQRYIVTGDVKGTGIIVTDGLTVGDRVVIEGLQRIRPGVAVDPVLATEGGE